MTAVWLCLIAWLVLSVPAGILAGRFIERGQR